MKSYKDIMKEKRINESRIKKICPLASEKSGIYAFTREEDEIKYAYIGQATKSLLGRMADHLSGFEQHIDRSLKKHKLYSENNPTGWKASIVYFCPAVDCDNMEQYFIKEYANKGYQLLNKTSGSQGTGKTGIAENRQGKGYREGVTAGYKKAQKEVAKLFENNLVFAVNGKNNKNKQKSYEKFEFFLKNCEK